MCIWKQNTHNLQSLTRKHTDTHRHKHKHNPRNFRLWNPESTAMEFLQIISQSVEYLKPSGMLNLEVKVKHKFLINPVEKKRNWNWNWTALQSPLRTGFLDFFVRSLPLIDCTKSKSLYFFYNISRELSEIWLVIASLFPRKSGITAKTDGITRLHCYHRLYDYLWLDIQRALMVLLNMPVLGSLRPWATMAMELLSTLFPTSLLKGG